MNILTDELDIKLWCCAEALQSFISQDRVLDVASQRTILDAVNEARVALAARKTEGK